MGLVHFEHGLTTNFIFSYFALKCLFFTHFYIFNFIVMGGEVLKCVIDSAMYAWRSLFGHELRIPRDLCCILHLERYFWVMRDYRPQHTKCVTWVAVIKDNIKRYLVLLAARVIVLYCLLTV